MFAYISVYSLQAQTSYRLALGPDFTAYRFSADRTNRRAYATVLCPSVVCNVCIVAKRCVRLTEKLSEEPNRKSSTGSRMVT